MAEAPIDDDYGLLSNDLVEAGFHYVNFVSVRFKTKTVPFAVEGTRASLVEDLVFDRRDRGG